MRWLLAGALLLHTVEAAAATPSKLNDGIQLYIGARFVESLVVLEHFVSEQFPTPAQQAQARLYMGMNF